MATGSVAAGPDAPARPPGCDQPILNEAELPTDARTGELVELLSIRRGAARRVERSETLDGGLVHDLAENIERAGQDTLDEHERVDVDAAGEDPLNAPGFFAAELVHRLDDLVCDLGWEPDEEVVGVPAAAPD